MKNMLLFMTIFVFVFNLNAQVQKDSTLNQPKFTPQEKIKKQKDEPSFKRNRLFFGGSLGFNFGNVTSIRVNPLIGYSLTPKLSLGLTGLYEYNSYETYYGKQNYSNYGGSVFSRFHIIPQLYAHAEFSYINYEFSSLNNATYRQGVPFVFLGGGYAQRIGGNSFVYAQILFDVLQDSNSPYVEWTPFYSVGVSIGF
jgi:hypothetical protein